ncbi:MAG TPA: hypothetical protein DCS93_00700 [Microscillaceae bacterium]|nr:hypothetical protein [Microscillaceae bacterium]
MDDDKIKINKKRSTYYGPLTISQTKILTSLATYKFLTSSQMVALGVMSHEKNINTQLRLMRGKSRPLVGCEHYGTIPKIGRLESVHYLTRKGKAFLVEAMDYEEDQVQLPIGTSSFFHQDYPHRKYTIDCQIAVNKWADKIGADILFFDRYFDKVGNNRRDKNMKAKTKIMIYNNKYIIADGIFMALIPDKPNELYCFEMYNGKDTKRTLGQLKKHIEVLELGTLSEQYGLDYAHQVLCVFEHESHMNAVIQRTNMEAVFTNVRELFLCKTLEQVQAYDFDLAWTNLQGDQVAMY